MAPPPELLVAFSVELKQILYIMQTSRKQCFYRFLPSVTASLQSFCGAAVHTWRKKQSRVITPWPMWRKVSRPACDINSFGSDTDNGSDKELCSTCHVWFFADKVQELCHSSAVAGAAFTKSCNEISAPPFPKFW